ncbi:MAG: CT583 family protein [Chlamydiales bacterium]|nr:CT583 family protein [Chlamydiales bacterium]
MAKLNMLLAERFKKRTKSSEKMDALANRTGAGELSSFGGVFRVTDLSAHEHEHLQQLLETYKDAEDQDIGDDLQNLCKLTSEVKAINNQAVVLHGERIQKAQKLLKNYRDGAFTEWLISSYGNRQTPYNFLQYYEFYTELSDMVKKKAEDLPRQVIYALASRTGEFVDKIKVIENFKGESKETLLSLIREKFPLTVTDKRQSRPAKKLISSLKRSIAEIQNNFDTTPREKDKIKALIAQLRTLVDV